MFLILSCMQLQGNHATKGSDILRGQDEQQVQYKQEAGRKRERESTHTSLASARISCSLTQLVLGADDDEKRDAEIAAAPSNTG